VFQSIGLPQVFDYMMQSKVKLPGITIDVLGKHVLKHPNHIEMVGSVLESPSPALYSDGEFETLTKPGNVRAVFFGSDPRNSFAVTYPNKSFQLVQLPGAGWNNCKGSFLVRGGTHITIRTNTQNGQVTSGNDFFTYLQAHRVSGSGVKSTINGFADFVTIFPFLWQNFVTGITAPIRWIQGKF
jgi:hypothetical protein